MKIVEGKLSAGPWIVVTLLVAALGLAPAGAQTAPLLFDDRDEFLAVTGSQRASAPYPATGTSACLQLLAPLDLVCASSSLLEFGERTLSLPLSGGSEPELSVLGPEDWSVETASPVHAFGFEVEDLDGTGLPPSTFTVVLSRSGQEVGRFVFLLRATALDRTFVGVWSPVAFDRLTVVEDETADADEYVGPVYAGTAPPPRGTAKIVDPSATEKGGSVAIDGDLVLTGGQDTGIADGVAYLYERHLGGVEAWQRRRRLRASDAQAFDQFGWDVSLSGKSAAVGAPGYFFGARRPGRAYVFERNSGGRDRWGQVSRLTSPVGQTGDFFGWSVSVSGDWLAVGAPGESRNPGGTVYVFERTPGGSTRWTLRAALAQPLGSISTFGRSVAISGSTVAVGAEFDVTSGGTTGAVHLFDRDFGGPGAWGYLTTVVGSNSAQGHAFGSTVALDGPTLVVGGRDHTEAYVFQQDPALADVWTETARLASPLAGYGDVWSVGVEGDVAVVGRLGVGVEAHGRHLGGSEVWGRLALVPFVLPDLPDDVDVSGNSIAAGDESEDPLNTSTGAVFVTRLPSLFEDGFESGDVAGWTSSTP